MPIVTTSRISPLSKYWTHEDVVSEALVMTKQTDNTNVQLHSVRVHMNLAISNISNMLNLASMPWYNLWLYGELEQELHPTGLHYIDLSNTSRYLEKAVLSNYTAFIPIHNSVVTPVITHNEYQQQFNPSQDLQEIQKVNINNSSPIKNSITEDFTNRIGRLKPWSGNFVKKDLSVLTELSTARNIAYRQDICWTHSGSELLFSIGNEILTQQNSYMHGITSIEDVLAETEILENTLTIPYTLVGIRNDELHPYPITIVATRKQRLDDLKAPEQSNTYKERVDLPDEYMDLLIKKVQKFVLTQLREQVPAQLEQEINQQQMQIHDQINRELQYEQAERQKVSYGYGQRPPGAM